MLTGINIFRMTVTLSPQSPHHAAMPDGVAVTTVTTCYVLKCVVVHEGLSDRAGAVSLLHGRQTLQHVSVRRRTRWNASFS